MPNNENAGPVESILTESDWVSLNSIARSHGFKKRLDAFRASLARQADEATVPTDVAMETVIEELEAWKDGRKSWTNLGHPPDVIATMDAQEVVKLSAYIQARAALIRPSAPAEQPRYPHGVDRDGHCKRCGLKDEPDEESMEPHVCPPGFSSAPAGDVAIGDEQLNKWLQLADSATMGPWYASANRPNQPEDHWGEWSVDSMAADDKIIAQNPARDRLERENAAQATISDNFYAKADAEFCAAARNAMPRLIAEVRRLAALIRPHVTDAGLREALEECHSALFVLFSDRDGNFPEKVNTPLGVPMKLRDIVESARRALTATASGGQWRSISEAPKDGTQVIIGSTKCNAVMLSTYSPGADWWRGWGPQKGPTHYQPLPLPPAPATAEQGTKGGAD